MRSDFLEKLNLPPDATEDQIKKSYRTLAKKYHPDVSKEENAREKFVEIAEAYEVLTNYPKKSAEQDFDDFFDFDFEQAYRQTAYERAKENAAKSYEAFKRNNLAFKKSWYYYPAKFLVYVIVVLGLSMAVSCLIGPLYFKYILGYENAFYAYIVLLPMTAWVSRFSYDIYKDSIPYFQDY